MLFGQKSEHSQNAFNLKQLCRALGQKLTTTRCQHISNFFILLFIIKLDRLPLAIFSGKSDVCLYQHRKVLHSGKLQAYSQTFD
jgi:hypothetical protein